MVAKTRRITPYYPEPTGSRFDRFAKSAEGLRLAEKNWYWKFRKPEKGANKQELPDRLDKKVIEEYGLDTIGFGNWVNQFNRLNFCAALEQALGDMELLLGKVKNGLGKTMLSIDWGGRGRKGAAALYHPTYKNVSLRRFTRPDKLLNRLSEIGIDTTPYLVKYFKPIRGQHQQRNWELTESGFIWALGSSGFGSLAHEYGHFIDNYMNVLQTNNGNSAGFASGLGLLPEPRSSKAEYSFTDIARTFFGTEPPSWLRETRDLRAALDGTPAVSSLYLLGIFIELYFDAEIVPIKARGAFGGEMKYTPNLNLKNLVSYCQMTKAKWTYWGSYVELWARIFEAWVQYKLEQKKIENTLLVSDYKKFEIQVKVVDGVEITKEVGRKVYPDRTSLKKTDKLIQNFLSIFAKY
jgi:hypothetical protein